jgi:tRNA threonylcarbamoyladenosine biosynthesis protein TsaB
MAPYVSMRFDGETHSWQGPATTHSEELAAAVLRLISSHHLSWSTLDRIVLGKGPGSFTGLRIGYAYAIGLALACAVPLQTISSLHATAFHLSRMHSNITYLALSDARRDELFTAVVKDGELIEEALLLPVESIRQRLESSDTQGVSIDTECVARLLNHPVLPAPSLSASLLDLSESISTPLYSTAAELSTLAPDYLRAVAARSLKDRGIVT